MRSWRDCSPSSDAKHRTWLGHMGSTIVNLRPFPFRPSATLACPPTVTMEAGCDASLVPARPETNLYLLVRSLLESPEGQLHCPDIQLLPWTAALASSAPSGQFLLAPFWIPPALKQGRHSARAVVSGFDGNLAVVARHNRWTSGQPRGQQDVAKSRLRRWLRDSL